MRKLLAVWLFAAAAAAHAQYPQRPVQLDWAPPAVADPRLRRLLAKLSS